VSGSTGPRADIGHEVLAQLRGEVVGRRPVDPGLAGGLREWLEDGIAPAVAGLGAERPLVVGPRSLRMAEAPTDRGDDPGSAHPAAGPVGPSRHLARAALVGVAFRLLVTTGRIEDPVTETLEALGADGRGHGVLTFIDRLGPDERAALDAEVAEHAAALCRGWPAIPASWLPRTDERISVPLAAGRVILRGRVDLVLGSPSSGRASVCLVNLASGPRTSGHRADRHYRGLLETLRSGAPPARLATVYSPSCEIDAEDVPDRVLAGSVQRTIDAVRELCRRAAGSQR